MNIIQDKLYAAGVRSLGNEHAQHLDPAEVREAGVSSYVDQAALALTGIGLAVLTAKASVYGFNHQPPAPMPTPVGVYNQNLNESREFEQLSGQEVSLPAPNVSPADIQLPPHQSVEITEQ